MGSSESAPSPDEDVVRRVRAGEVDAFELLVERHEDRMMRVVSRNVPRQHAAEVAHEVFVAAYLSLDGYRGPGPFEHWLTRIALRTCSDYWRREYRERGRREPLEALEEPAARAVETPQGAQRERLDRALERLDLEDRQVLTLVYFEGLSVRECAELLDWSEANVKVRAHRARKRLREWILSALPGI